MKFETFKTLYGEAKEYADFETYKSERGWQEWMDEYISVCDVSKILNYIYLISNGNVKNIRTCLRLKQTEISKYLNVPYKSWQKWDAEDAKITDYHKMWAGYCCLDMVISEDW